MDETRPEDNTQYRAINPPGNSNKSKNPAGDQPKEKEIKQVTAHEATLRKKGLGTRIKESFTGDDATSVGSYLLFSVVVPACQQLVVDAFTEGVERMILGDSRPNRTRRTNERRSSGINYNRIYGNNTQQAAPTNNFSSRSRETHDFDQILIADRGEAEYVLECLGDILEQYEQVTVRDLYKLVGIRPSFTDANWGWFHLRGAQARRVNGGYILVLPPPQDLDRR